MFKLLMAGALILTAALPVGAQEVNSKSFKIAQSSYPASVCTNDVGGTLNLRRRPGQNQRIMLQIPRGQGVYVISDSVRINGRDWVQVTYGNKTGWVDSQYLCPIP
ncbi:SH3 domain-containing protein [Calothrix sp. FACHB-1219]|uniref:SH3 domain-containing protein n=1 Tax=unclassified Calothrix TaxID=2619626 RepID=UPI0016874BFB|nr:MULTISPECIES: SH3 domain-containing protein [unclassified Calothrix]MBD2204593.1 SH3 domain-containing protein [Calothrix sp. FACHB-168]MBD2219391.1 SH3 domain-containing protein [Calothrix sp. FACHB-1219]